MRLLIEETLRPLIGLPLWASRRAGALQGFHFGAQLTATTREGEEVVVGAYVLHVQCAWRIRDGDSVLVGSDDLYEGAGSDLDRDPNFKWDRADANRRDERIDALFGPEAQTRFVVRGVKADNVGGITISFDGGRALEVFPNSTHLDDYDEYWRFFEGGTEARHFVVPPPAAEG